MWPPGFSEQLSRLVVPDKAMTFESGFLEGAVNAIRVIRDLV